MINTVLPSDYICNVYVMYLFYICNAPDLCLWGYFQCICPLFHFSLKATNILYCTVHSRFCGEQGVHYKHLKFYIECEELLRLYLSYCLYLITRLESMIPPGLILIPHSREKTRVVLCTTILQLVVEVVEKLKWKV